MLKRAVCFLAAAAMVFCCAFASAWEGHTFEMPALGMDFAFPREFEDAKGYIGTDGVMELGEGSYYFYLYYCAVPRDDFHRLYDEDPGTISSKAGVLFYAFAVGGGKDFAEVTRLTGGSLTADGAVKLGQAGDYSFFLYWIEDADYAASIGEEYGKEYGALCALKDRAASFFKCYEPLNEHTSLNGSVIRFTATDLDGNSVSSEELFSAHEVTLVNIWATWCGPCKSELRQLQDIHARFQDRDCAVVGLLSDSDVEEARRLMKENGITYDVVLISTDFSFVFPYSAIPTTFFVDRSGAFLGTTFVGAYPDKYAPALESLLGK